MSTNWTASLVSPKIAGQFGHFSAGGLVRCFPYHHLRIAGWDCSKYRKCVDEKMTFAEVNQDTFSQRNDGSRVPYRPTKQKVRISIAEKRGRWGKRWWWWLGVTTIITLSCGASTILTKRALDRALNAIRTGNSPFEAVSLRFPTFFGIRS